MCSSLVHESKLIKMHSKKQILTVSGKPLSTTACIFSTMSSSIA